MNVDGALIVIPAVSHLAYRRSESFRFSDPPQ
jgi:hypothetical protein